MAYPEKLTLAHKYLTAHMVDVSTADSAYVPVAAQGELVGIMSVIHGAITGADAAITVEVNGTAVTGATLTIANSGSAAGDVDSNFTFNPYPVKQGDVIEFITDGASSTAREATFLAVVKEL